MKIDKIKEFVECNKIEIYESDIDKVLEILLFCIMYCADKETTDYCKLLADGILKFKYEGGK